MSRILVVFVALTLLVSCGKSTEEGEDTAATQAPPSAERTRSEPNQAIPDEAELSEFETIANAYIRPYFDLEGTQTRKAISPGDYFDIYIVAEFNELYPMSAAEYKMVLPEGVMVMGTAQSDSIILTLGKWDNDFMIAFHCTSGPKAMLMKYQCKVDESFRGGLVETMKGADLNFLGFTMCDEPKTLIQARGGKAELTKK